MLKNRKADNSPWGVMFAIIIGVVLVIAIVYWILYGSTGVKTTLNIVSPTEIGARVQACRVFASTSDYADFCADFKEVGLIGGGKGFINCDYQDIRIGLEKASVDLTSMKCTGNEAQEYCKRWKVNNDKTKTIKIYGKDGGSEDCIGTKSSDSK